MDNYFVFQPTSALRQKRAPVSIELIQLWIKNQELEEQASDKNLRNDKIEN